jgi:hypothetical protein
MATEETRLRGFGMRINDQMALLDVSVGLGCFMSLAVRLLRELLAGSRVTSWLTRSHFFCKMVGVDLFYSCSSMRPSRIFARVMGYDLINDCILLPDGASKCLGIIGSSKMSAHEAKMATVFTDVPIHRNFP